MCVELKCFIVCDFNETLGGFTGFPFMISIHVRGLRFVTPHIHKLSSPAAALETLGTTTNVDIFFLCEYKMKISPQILYENSSNLGMEYLVRLYVFSAAG